MSLAARLRALLGRSGAGAVRVRLILKGRVALAAVAQLALRDDRQAHETLRRLADSANPEIAAAARAALAP